MKLVEVECGFCGAKVQKKEKHIKYATNKGQTVFYCSLKCVSSKKGTTLESCFTCSKDITRTTSAKTRSKSGRFYCSKHCATIQNNKTYRSGPNNPNWIHGLRVRNQKPGDACEGCGDLRYFLLLTHHKDKNRQNNNPNNWEKICYNCHVLRHLRLSGTRIVVDWNVLTSPAIKDLLSQGLAQRKSASPGTKRLQVRALRP